MRRNRRITTCGMLGTDRIRSIKDTGHVRSPVQGDDCVRRITRRWHNPTMRTLALVVVLVLSCVGVVMPVGCSPGAGGTAGTVGTAEAGGTTKTVDTPGSVDTLGTVNTGGANDSASRSPGSLGEISGSGAALGECLVSDIVVTLLHVIDGDTIRVRMPDGTVEKVRYIGIDAPEVAHRSSCGECLGEEATAHNVELLTSGPLRLRTDVEERDPFGRLLAYVWAGEVFINERMVRDGYARARNYPPNLSLQDRLWEAHDEARKAGIGIWSR